MKRYIRLCLLSLFMGMLAFTGSYAIDYLVGGTIGPDSVRVVLKGDTTRVLQQVKVQGTLIIEPGARIEFDNGSRIIVAAGGRIIADGFATLKQSEHQKPSNLTTPDQIINAFDDGYHDMRYFLYPAFGPGSGTMRAGLVLSDERLARERTVHPTKFNTIFNVAVDMVSRRLVNIANPNDGTWPTTDVADSRGIYTQHTPFGANSTNRANSNIYVIPFETAILFMASRMSEFPTTNNSLALKDWGRLNGTSADVKPATIEFIGQPQNTNSREWGHIVVLPGARAAFFRNCLFENFKKDTTVDNVPYYQLAEVKHNLDAVELNELNKEMLELTNGGGGAITTFSSRTWILDCNFSRNFARLRGGAVQILQTPTSFFYPKRIILASDTTGCERFNFDNPEYVKNYRVSDPDKFTSTVLTRNKLNFPSYPMIDKIFDPGAEDSRFINDLDRQAWDDARLAGYLGRFRNLNFENNMVRLANVAALPDEGGRTVVRDDTSSVVLYPYSWGNGVKGGAMYISGTEDEGREIEFALGMNDSIRLGNFPQALYNPNVIINHSQTGYKDYLRFVGNTAHNYQDNLYSDGAKGGAIYVGKNTSLIVAGEFINNYTNTKWLVDTTGKGTFTDGKPTPYQHGIMYSQGGAIYSDPDANGRIQIRGDVEKDQMRKRTSEGAHTQTTIKNPTTFTKNRAGVGGAIYVADSRDVLMSPHIGGSDAVPVFNGYGYNIEFNNNYAYSAGGAIYAKRNMEVWGAGGANGQQRYAYSLNHLIRFDSNDAGFAGGAIHVEIPKGRDYDLPINARIINLCRIEFRDNNVNELAFVDAAHLNNQLVDQIRGGGAVYTLWADLNVVKGVRFLRNNVFNGNGGAIAMVGPHKEIDRFFVTDLDIIHYAPIAQEYQHIEGLPRIANSFTSVNNPFTYGADYNQNSPLYRVSYPDEYDDFGNLILKSGDVPAPHFAMLTIFEENSAVVDYDRGQYQIEHYGNTQIKKGYIMPEASNSAQFWTSEENGFVGGNVGHLTNIYYQNNNWTWSPAYNDSLWYKERFNNIYFSSTNTGYFATNHGKIIKTTNRGANWNIVYQSTDKGEGITDMSFITGANDRAIAVTDQGRVITTENGNTWNVATWNYSAKKFYGAHLVSGTLGYVVGSDGAVIKMTRTGSDWDSEQLYVPGLNKDLNKVFFVSPNKGFAVGNEGTFVYTTDGGATWDILLNVFPRNEKLTDIKFVGGSIGYITTGSGRIWKTEDGGSNWERLSVNFNKSINSLFLLDYDKLFVVGEEDLVMRSLDGGDTWISLEPANKSEAMGNPKIHANFPSLVENGIGLGGAIYILDNQNRDDGIKLDSVKFNRARIIDNFAFTGSAIYSDNYNLKLLFNRSLIRGNVCDTNNTIGMLQNHITGPLSRESQYPETNLASSDLASATIYGEIQGPFPSNSFHTTANSIFENQARFLVRLPDAPHTKGILAGLNDGVGTGGVDTLRGNYWGHTEANVGLKIMNHQFPHTGAGHLQDRFETFFLEKKIKGQSITSANANNLIDNNYLPFYNNYANYSPVDYRRQGPFEYNSNAYRFGDRGIFQYEFIELKNQPNTVSDFENIPGDMTIPEKYLFSYDIYDLYDKGTDIKVADYTQRRMFPIEDFAVGNPVQLYLDDEEYLDMYDQRADLVKRQKYVKRWVRDPEYANAKTISSGNVTDKYPEIARLQRTWAPLNPDKYSDNVPRYYHPLGMPIYLETKARTHIGNNWETGRDMKRQGSTVFFIINETTQDFIRVNLKQVPRGYGEETERWVEDIYRATIFLVPDSSRRGNVQDRRYAEGLDNLGSNGTYPFGGTDGGIDPILLKKLSPRGAFGEPNPGIGVAARNEDFAALGGRKYQTISGNYTYDPTRPSPYTNEDGKPYQTQFNLGDADPYRLQPGLFSNRPNMPDNNFVQVGTGAGARYETQTTFFAGERYGTLPVNVGDVVRVISRNVLWRQGVVDAYEGGLVFIVQEGPEAPLFTGDINMWGTPELNPYVTDANGDYPIYVDKRVDENGNFTESPVVNHGLLNKVFVRTNRTYPYSAASTTVPYSHPSRQDNDRGTDFILKATALDRNGFYDPRNEYQPSQFTSLIWRWNFVRELGMNDANDPATVEHRPAGLEYWLMADTFKQSLTINEQVHSGYLEFKGTPINPYIVPGGERIQVSVRNYAPGIDMLDSLKKSNMEEYIPWFYKIFPPYLNAPFYNQDVTGEGDRVARYLQQDTMDIRGNAAVAEDIRIYVMDSLPKFINYVPESEIETTQPLTFPVKAANYQQGAAGNVTIDRPYSWSRFQAGQTLTTSNPLRDDRAKFLVNVTSNEGLDENGSVKIGKLRFKMDLNTDDELEDFAAEEALYPAPWDFRYGRMAYSFENITINSNDTLILDTISGTVVESSQLKPNWMQYGYFMQYDNYADFEPTGFEFQRRGQINIRIDEPTAKNLLRKTSSLDQYNTDTLMAIVANDGHGGTATKFIDLYINFQPEFLTQTLLGAVEGEEYNLRRDETRAIRITDANQDQRHRFQLIYNGTNVSNYVAYDRSFPAETPINWNNIPRRTPDWLQINPVSGVLYGVPTLLTNYADTIAEVTVLVEDEDGLINIQTFNMKIKPGNCPPKLLVAPIIECLTRGSEINEDIVVFDRDLLRTGDTTERLRIWVANPQSGLTIEPEEINGPLTETVTVKLKHTGNGFDYLLADLVNGRLPVMIIVEDRSGQKDTLEFSIRVSDEVEFLSRVKVTNYLGHTQLLEWGTARSATTGDGLDVIPGPGAPVGHLDADYCEIEIPPLTEPDVFDARWAIPTINGTYRNIFPTARASVYDTIAFVYKGTFQAGGVQAGGSSTNYPVTLSWKPAEIPAKNGDSKNPFGSTWIIRDGGSAGSYFAVDMNNISNRKISAVINFIPTNANGEASIVITDNKIENFHIIHDWYSNAYPIDGVGIDGSNYEFVTAINRMTPAPARLGDSPKLDFTIGKPGLVTIEMFDVLGGKVSTIVNDFFGAGNYEIDVNLIDFTGSKLVSGTYQIRMTSGMEIKDLSFIVIP